MEDLSQQDLAVFAEEFEDRELVVALTEAALAKPEFCQCGTRLIREDNDDWPRPGWFCKSCTTTWIEPPKL